MRSKTSCFNATLFRKNAARFWPLWAVYTLIWFLAAPGSMLVDFLSGLRYGQTDWSYLSRMADRYILSDAASLGLVLVFVASVVMALAVFSYLYNSRSAGLMHTLPIRREGLFLTNYLSGLSFLLVPHAVVALLTLLVELAAGVLNLEVLLLWFLVLSGGAFFFYTFAVFCAMFTGHAAALPVFYGILNFLVIGLYTLIHYLMGLFAFGYYGLDDFPKAVAWFTPIAQLMENLGFHRVDLVEHPLAPGVVEELGVTYEEVFRGMEYVLVYVILAVVFLFAALAVYRRRHVETAGDIIAVGWVKPIFKYGFAFCCALCGGMGLAAMFSPLFDGPLVPVALFTCLCGVVGFFVAEMLLQKSFKVFSRGWKSCGVFAAVLVLLVVGLSMDLFGYERRVPDAGQVSTVQFNSGYDFTPYDEGSWHSFEVNMEEDIQMVIDLHQTIVDQRDTLETSSRHYSWEGDRYSFYLRFNYTMKDGSRLNRAYSVLLPVSENPDPDSVEGKLLALVNSEAYRMDAYFPYEERGGSAIGGSLMVFDRNMGTLNVEFTSEQAERIAQAALEDVRAGRLGIRYFQGNSPEYMENCAATDLCLTFAYTVGDGEGRTSSVNITPQFSATSLMDTLRELNILSEERWLCSLAELEIEEVRSKDLEIGAVATESYAYIPEPSSTVVISPSGELIYQTHD